MTKRDKRKEKKRKRVSGRKRAEEHRSVYEGSSVQLPSGVSFFSIKKRGVYRFEIIPYTVPDGAGNPNAEDGDLYFERTFWVHRSIGPENETVVCPSKTAKKPCPICEFRAKEVAKGEDGDEELIKSLGPRERQLWNVYDHADAERGVQVWDISYHLFGKQLDARIKNADEDEDYEFFADPEDGSTLKVGFSEESFAGRNYYQAESIDFKPRVEALDPDIFAKANCLDEMLVIEPYDKLYALFFQTSNVTSEKKPKKDKGGNETPTAEERGLSRGDIVEHKVYGKCKIVKISPDGTSLSLMDEDDDIQRAIGANEVELLQQSQDKKKKKNKNKKSKKDELLKVEKPEPQNETFDDSDEKAWDSKWGWGDDEDD